VVVSGLGTDQNGSGCIPECDVRLREFLVILSALYKFGLNCLTVSMSRLAVSMSVWTTFKVQKYTSSIRTTIMSCMCSGLVSVFVGCAFSQLDCCKKTKEEVQGLCTCDSTITKACRTSCLKVLILLGMPMDERGRGRRDFMPSTCVRVDKAEQMDARTPPEHQQRSSSID
jgi:hypothetical protein